MSSTSTWSMQFMLPGPALGVLAHQQLHVELQHVGDLVDDGELVEPAYPTLDLVDPALRLAEAVGEDLLGHLSASPPVRHSAPYWQLVHKPIPSRRSHVMCGHTRIDARTFECKLQ